MVCVWYGLIMFFVFKQKTAYEMRISDWSSDVCSSDLRLRNMTALKPRATGSRTQEHPSAFRARISAHRSSAANASRSTAAAAISPIQLNSVFLAVKRQVEGQPPELADTDVTRDFRLHLGRP